jgi:HK97 family phage major capsid protein
VRNELSRAVIERMDIDFIDPAKAAVAGVSPASILNGVTPITMTGSDAAAVRAALGDLLGAYLAANNNPTSAVIIVPPTLALEWSMLTNALGQPEFPSLSMNGGTLMGIPVITSQYALIGGNALFIMVNASDVFLADDGGVSVDASREASILMSDTPVADAATGTTVSMWQNNMLALRAERFVNWAKRRAGAAQYISVDVTP